MSREGNCLDNAVAESFFKTIKVKEFTKPIIEQEKKLNQNCFNTLKVGTTQDEFTAVINKNLFGMCMV